MPLPRRTTKSTPAWPMSSHASEIASPHCESACPTTESAAIPCLAAGSAVTPRPASVHIEGRHHRSAFGSGVDIVDQAYRAQATGYEEPGRAPRSRHGGLQREGVKQFE